VIPTLIWAIAHLTDNRAIIVPIMSKVMSKRIARCMAEVYMAEVATLRGLRRIRMVELMTSENNNVTDRFRAACLLGILPGLVSVAGRHNPRRARGSIGEWFGLCGKRPPHSQDDNRPGPVT